MKQDYIIVRKRGIDIGKTSLNDLIYSFEPLKIVTPDSDYKVDEVQLQKSIQKSKEMMTVIEEYKRKRAVPNS